MSRRLIGVLAGWTIWITFLAMAFIYRVQGAREYVPMPVREVSDFVMIGIELAAWPIGLGGWIWVWGDAGPPLWAKAWTPHIAVGLLVFGVLGALGSSLFARKRFRQRALLLAITLFALVLGLAAVGKLSL